jgi:hypothetical protein
MGFEWDVAVSVKFCQPVQMPEVPVRVIKRLIAWTPSVSIETMQKRELGLSSTKKKRKRHKEYDPEKLPARGPALDDENDELSADDEDAFSDEQRAEMAALRQVALMCDDGKPRYHPDVTINIEYNLQHVFDNAFQLAADRLLGKGHGLGLTFETGGAYFEASHGASEQLMRIEYKAAELEMDGICEAPRGAINVPWGCSSMKIVPLSREKEAEVLSNMKRVVDAFGFSPDGEAGWHLCSRASGG